MSRFLFLLILPCLCFAKAEYQDLKESISYLWQGSYMQFGEVNNAYYLLPALSTTVYSFEHDKRLSDHQRSKKLRKIYDITGDLGIAFNFPIVPISIYYLGKSQQEETGSKTIQFAKEYMATMYLTLIETGLISYIPSHERPYKEEQSFWETAFRGKNSFPSGHIVPYSALFFKTLQFYGPYWATIPGVLTYFASMQRVREGRHYVSDVVGAFWLSAFASEGVRAAGKYKKNHPFYKFIFEREAKVSIIIHRGVVGPAITFNL